MTEAPWTIEQRQRVVEWANRVLDGKGKIYTIEELMVLVAQRDLKYEATMASLTADKDALSEALDLAIGEREGLEEELDVCQEDLDRIERGADEP